MFVDEWFADDFYEKVQGPDPAEFDSVFWTHVYYPHENLELWRPVVDPQEPTKTIATDFRIQPARQDAFARGIPLASPKLESNEEFLVLRAKKRPVLLIRPELPSLGNVNQGFKTKVDRRRSIVAQVFGLANTHTGAAKFSDAFLERVRRMEWPQFAFLPKHAGLFSVDSLLRLDELQSVFTPHLQSTHWRLGDGISEVLSDQLTFLLTQRGTKESNKYLDLREMLISS